MLERLNKKPASTQIVSSFDRSTRLCASDDSTALHLGPRALGWPRDLIDASRERHHGSGRITPPPSPSVAAMMLVAENDTTVERNNRVRTTRRSALIAAAFVLRDAATRPTTNAGKGGTLDGNATGGSSGQGGRGRSFATRPSISARRVKPRTTAFRVSSAATTRIPWTRGNHYCARAGHEGQLLLEGNYFDGVTSPHEFNSAADEMTASITARDNTYTGTSENRDTGGGGPSFTSAPMRRRSSRERRCPRSFELAPARGPDVACACTP
jgi:hypothetical protein